MDYPVGELFYHYTRRSAAFEHILPTRKLRFSPYARMKDPLENKPWPLAAPYDLTGRRDLDREGLKAAARDLHDLDGEWASAKLLALTVDAETGYENDSAKPFGGGWSRARMWEQYAQKQKESASSSTKRRFKGTF
jgi:hypothetical protein